MNKILLGITVAVFFVLSSCTDKKETYYERPAWLQGPLFEQIKSTGKYNEFVKAAEYCGYDKFLSSRLVFTLFLPTDDAFKEYYQEKGINSIEDLSEDEVTALLQFHTLQNSWDSLKMAGKTSFGYWGSYPNNFRTPCIYTLPITQENGRNVYFDNTFLLVFSNALFNANNYNSTDYETFYPGSTWTGYNVDRGAILEQEQGSENGFYYVINRVLIPRTTADMVIGDIPEFSLFKKLLDRFVVYNYNTTQSQNYPQYAPLYKKSYALNFNLANEKIPDNAYDGYYHVYNTVFVPGDQDILDYFSNNFPDYATIDDVPNIIAKYFVEAHMIPGKKLFPSVLASPDNVQNDFSDEITFDLDNGISSEYISSNALIYGINQAINTNAFFTVSGPIIRNPKYTIFTMMLEISGEITSFFNQKIKHAVFVLPDDMMTNMGFVYDEGDPVDFTDDQIYRNNNEYGVDSIKNFLKNYISISTKDVNGTDIAYIATKNDKYLKVGNNTVEGLFGTANIKNSYTATNGMVFEIDNDLSPDITYTMEDYLNDHKADFSEFFTLCDSAGMVKDSLLIKLSVVPGNKTLLLPTNQAIQNIKGTYIPANASNDNFNFRYFIQYHLISELVFFTDNEIPENPYGTDLYINSVRYKVNIGASGGVVDVTDRLNNHFQITAGPNTNIITSNGVIHVVDQALEY